MSQKSPRKEKTCCSLQQVDGLYKGGDQSPKKVGRAQYMISSTLRVL